MKIIFTIGSGEKTVMKKALAFITDLVQGSTAHVPPSSMVCLPN
jgi:hypothetical protein